MIVLNAFIAGSCTANALHQLADERYGLATVSALVAILNLALALA